MCGYVRGMLCDTMRCETVREGVEQRVRLLRCTCAVGRKTCEEYEYKRATGTWTKARSLARELDWTGLNWTGREGWPQQGERQTRSSNTTTKKHQQRRKERTTYTAKDEAYDAAFPAMGGGDLIQGSILLWDFGGLFWDIHARRSCRPLLLFFFPCMLY